MFSNRRSFFFQRTTVEEASLWTSNGGNVGRDTAMLKPEMFASSENVQR